METCTHFWNLFSTEGYTVSRAQTLLQTITRTQLYSECGMYYLKHEQASSALADIKDESAAPVFYNYYLIKHGL